MTDELDKKIEDLELAWKRHHKEPHYTDKAGREHGYHMPNMIELNKLRYKREQLKRVDRWET